MYLNKNTPNAIIFELQQLMIYKKYSKCNSFEDISKLLKSENLKILL